MRTALHVRLCAPIAFVACVASFANVNVAHASPGYDPDGTRDTICRLLDDATTTDDVEDLFAVWGAQEVTDTAYAGCSRNNMKVLATLMDNDR